MSSVLQKVAKHSNISLKLCSRKFHLNAVRFNKKWWEERKLPLNPYSSGALKINKNWREERKLPVNPNSFGPLTNLPDYSFADNRPVPYGSNQKRRIDKQREQLVKIKQLVGEIDYAVERHELLQKQAEENKRQILQSKLKEKGSKLLEKKMVEEIKQ